jgi:heme-degrading monooxygenase HmoA
LWTGRTKAEDYETYLTYLEESGVAELRATPGNRGVMVLRRLDGDKAEFGVMSFWDSLARTSTRPTTTRTTNASCSSSPRR